VKPFKFPKLKNRTVYVVQYASGVEYLNREPLSREDKADLMKRGQIFRELKYRLVS